MEDRTIVEYICSLLAREKMGWFKDWREKRKLKKYMRKTPEEEYAIYKRRLLAGETETSARSGLKHLPKAKKKK